jgi:hypothetical protein
MVKSPVNPEQVLNALLEIVVTESGMIKEPVMLLQLAKQLPPMVTRLLERVMLVREEQPEKEERLVVVTPFPISKLVMPLA